MELPPQPVAIAALAMQRRVIRGRLKADAGYHGAGERRASGEIRP